MGKKLRKDWNGNALEHVEQEYQELGFGFDQR